MIPILAEKQQTYYKSIDMDFVCSSFFHRGCTNQAYQTESITDDQVGCELPGVILDLDDQETKKKKGQIDSHPKSCPPSIQRTLFLNNETLETSTNPNGMDDPNPNKVTYKSMCGMMTKVLFDVLPKVLPHAVVKNVLANEVLPYALNDILSKVMPAFLEKAMHQNLYNMYGTASDFANKKDKTKEVDNKDSKATKLDRHAPKVNESTDKKDKPEEVDNKDSEAAKSDRHAPKVYESAEKKDKPEEVDNKDFGAPKLNEHALKVDEFEVAVEVHIF
ncbi:hypothetical protein LWI28_025565 [Acer negundo]|uniref:Uncharacterized protein n=1 Tax=Acer negundo TaxID=4023 RepID=A0AAD5JHP5_ACENE|nr:hypothetical protein LWI28_025565 [Acer negundo]